MGMSLILAGILFVSVLTEAGSNGYVHFLLIVKRLSETVVYFILHFPKIFDCSNFKNNFLCD